MCVGFCVFFFKQKTAYEMRISDWSSDVCSSDLLVDGEAVEHIAARRVEVDVQRPLELSHLGQEVVRRDAEAADLVVDKHLGRAGRQVLDPVPVLAGAGLRLARQPLVVHSTPLLGNQFLQGWGGLNATWQIGSAHV